MGSTRMKMGSCKNDIWNPITFSFGEVKRPSSSYFLIQNMISYHSWHFSLNIFYFQLSCLKCSYKTWTWFNCNSPAPSECKTTQHSPFIKTRTSFMSGSQLGCKLKISWITLMILSYTQVVTVEKIDCNCQGIHSLLSKLYLYFPTEEYMLTAWSLALHTTYFTCYYFTLLCILHISDFISNDFMSHSGPQVKYMNSVWERRNTWRILPK